MKMITMAVMAAAISVSMTSAQAAPAAPIGSMIKAGPEIIQVAGGCGPNAWRGPYGGCRNTPFYGRLPNGYYQPPPHPMFGCPEGYWRGPWGHCRNTPYHGPLPGGGFK